MLKHFRINRENKTHSISSSTFYGIQLGKAWPFALQDKNNSKIKWEFEKKYMIVHTILHSPFDWMTDQAQESIKQICSLCCHRSPKISKFQNSLAQKINCLVPHQCNGVQQVQSQLLHHRIKYGQDVQKMGPKIYFTWKSTRRVRHKSNLAAEAFFWSSLDKF